MPIESKSGHYCYTLLVIERSYSFVSVFKLQLHRCFQISKAIAQGFSEAVNTEQPHRSEISVVASSIKMSRLV